LIRFDAIGRAWALFRQEPGTWLLAALITIVILAGINGASFMLSIPLGVVMSAALGGFGGLLISLLGTAVFVAVQGVLMAGLIRMAVKQVDGEKFSLGEMFVFDNALPQVIVAWLLYLVAAIIGVFLLVVPSWIAVGVLMFALPLAAEGKRSGVRAIQESWATLKGAWFSATVFHLVLAVLMAAGGLLCGLGILVTFPLYVLAIAVVYRDHYPNKAKGQGIATEDLLAAPRSRIPGWAWLVVVCGFTAPILVAIAAVVGMAVLLRTGAQPGFPGFPPGQMEVAFPEPGAGPGINMPGVPKAPGDEIDKLLATLKTGNAFEKDFTLAMLPLAVPKTPRRGELANVLVTLLNDPKSRAKAAEALVVWATPEQVPALIDALSSDDDEVRRHAAKALGRLSDERGNEALAAHLADPRDRSQTSEALVAAGASARDAVVKLQGNDDPEVRQEVTKILEKIDAARSDAAVAEGEVATKEPFPGNPPAVGGRRVRALPNLSGRRRGAIAPERSLTQVLANLRGNDSAARLKALGQLVGSQPIPARQDEVTASIVPLLSDPDVAVRAAAVRALGAWGTADAVEPLLAALNDPDPLVISLVIPTLGELKDLRACATLATLLINQKHRQSAARALTAAGSLAETAVVPMLRNRDFAVRIAVCEILETIGTKACVAGLNRATHDANRSVATAAKSALSKVNERLR